MRNPDQFPAESVNSLNLHEQYPTPESMARDLALRKISWAEVTERFPAEETHEQVYEMAQAIETQALAEQQAEEELAELLEDAHNTFLTIPQNMELIENAETAAEALSIAQAKIREREERTFKFEGLRQVEGVELVSADLEGVKSTIHAIKESSLEIGRGGDAFVVVYKGEVEDLPQEICYKFAIEESVKRGRNTVAQEAEIHTHFFDVVNEIPESKFGVPMPYYSTEIGNEQMIAMERLPAKSVDDILRGHGMLPDWIDIDVFCDELTSLLDHLHENGLYHRDMHEGNVMIRQTSEEPEDGKWGYLIDFGLSGHGVEDMDPYKKDVAGTRFTYNNDYGIIKIIRQDLNNLRRMNVGNQRRV